ncbi:FAD:protein FMN transferase [Streptomyces sp. NPDC048416]|uniref:FAD:protein FMN transferase n=1 Tax=Streptomyces sp. NPDC048416 TaxID=3365546 RepID=UPI00371838EA
MNQATEGLRHAEHVMGTVFSFDIRDRPTRDIRDALAEAVTWLHHVDAVFSPYRPDSDISRLARGDTGLSDCPPEVADVLALCDDATAVTDGWFSHHASGRLDPCGLVKGWATERASHILYDAGAHNTCVNGGGDLQLRGEASPGTPWRVGIAHPWHPGRLLRVVSGRDLAVATSGTAERGHHILDPGTGLPAAGPASVTVTGRHLTQVDAYATALFAMGAEAARSWTEDHDGYETLLLTSAGDVWQSGHFPAVPGTPS